MTTLGQEKVDPSTLPGFTMEMIEKWEKLSEGTKKIILDAPPENREEIFRVAMEDPTETNPQDLVEEGPDKTKAFFWIGAFGVVGAIAGYLASRER